ncbi:MAG TPA: DNA N-6-adenine-methyltransferase [Ktedonobacterales bacterium]|nr:DNA N-6-adenine-methyltransferase [Ktedonobacterales bacterium]
MRPHQKALETSASDRWFTPPDLLAEIRTFLGDYYDPCPARNAGERVESGLWQAWPSVVFVNPPYGRVIGRWIVKAMTEPIDELLLLVPARTDTAWFQSLYDYPICFVRGRLRFNGSTQNAPFPSALVYRGPRVEAFCRAFAHRGPIVRRIAA